MPTRRKSAPQTVEFPRYFTEISCTVRIPVNRAEFKTLFETLREIPGLSVRSDGEGLKGALRGERGWGSTHTHFTLEREDSNAFVFRLDVFPTSHGRFIKGVPSTSRFLKILRGALHEPATEVNGLLGARFLLSTDSWSPTVPLPFSPPGALDRLPGVPRISGLDFSFSEPTPDQPLIRAFITTYESLQEMSVRFLLMQRVSLDSNLPRVMAAAAARYLPSFADERR